MSRVIWLCMIFLVKFAPRKSSHLIFNKRKHSPYPVYDGIEIIDEFRDAGAETVVAHIFLCFATADPFKSRGKKVLSVCSP